MEKGGLVFLSFTFILINILQLEYLSALLFCSDSLGDCGGRQTIFLFVFWKEFLRSTGFTCEIKTRNLSF